MSKHSGFVRRRSLLVPAHLAAAAAAPSFAPTDVANLYTWHRADLGRTMSGGNVSLLADQSGNGFDMVPAFSSGPTLVTADSNFNGHDSLSMPTGNNAFKTSSSSLVFDQMDIFIVKNSNTAGYMLNSQPQNSAAGSLFSYTSGVASALETNGFNSGPRLSNVSGWGMSASTQTINLQKKSSGYKAFVNEVDTGATMIGSDPGAITIQLFVGTSSGAASPNQMNGNVAEMIIYNRILNSTERAQVYTYLKGRYANY